MTYITDNTVLKEHIPNSFREAAGERTFFEKIAQYISAAEDWFVLNILGESLDAGAQEEAILKWVRKGVAAMALYDAIPGLDLVLTPNGYGVVNTTNVVPASRDRVDRLREAMLKERDFAIRLLLERLFRLPSWRESEVADQYFASLFNCPGDVSQTCSYDEYIDFASSVINVEAMIAERYVSAPLMESLRLHRRANLGDSEKFLVQSIRVLAKDVLNGESAEHIEAQGRYIVETIRNNAELAEVWQNSSTARSWSVTRFQNKSGSAGFWF